MFCKHLDNNQDALPLIGMRDCKLLISSVLQEQPSSQLHYLNITKHSMLGFTWNEKYFLPVQISDAVSEVIFSGLVRTVSVIDCLVNLSPVY